MHQTESVSPAGAQDQHSGATRFRPDIQGLRAIAVLAVVLFHAELPGLGGGFVGVDVFFVISGFLITGTLWREAHSTGSVKLRRFYGARARRLLPASALVGIVTMVAAVLLLPAGASLAAILDGAASALYVSNYWFILQDVSYFNIAGHMPPSPFLHYWSLGVEEQFYLVWPALILVTALLIRLVRRRTRTEATSSRRPYLVVLALVATMSFALSLLITYVMPAIAFFSLPTRAWQLALGGLIALTAGQWRRISARVAAMVGVVGLGMILLACTWLTATTIYPGFAALLPTVGTALVIGSGCAATTSGFSLLLGWTPLQAIGRISYSWYLWHWPVLILAPDLFGHPLGLPGRLAGALLSAGLAWLTLRYVEDPLRFSPRIRNSPWRSLGLGALSTATAVLTAVALTFTMPSMVGTGSPAAPLVITAAPVPPGSPQSAYDAVVEQVVAQMQTAIAQSLALNAVPSNLTPTLLAAPNEKNAMGFDGCVRDFFEAGQPECAFGDLSSATRVALIGDSHAAMLIPGFQQLADERHWRLETLAKSGCPSVDVPITNNFQQLAERLQHCEQWRVQVLDRLNVERPQLIVVSLWRQYGSGSARNWQPGFSAYDPAWLDALTHLVRQLRDTGAKVLVLGPVPDPQSVVPSCLSAHLTDARACAPLRSAAVNQSGITAEDAATTAGGGQYADLTDLFCSTERCPVIVGNSLVFLDWSHITLEYSRVLAPAMGALADRALATHA